MVLLVYFFVLVATIDVSNHFDWVERIKLSNEQKSEIDHEKEKPKIKVFRKSKSGHSIRIFESLYKNIYSDESGAAVYNIEKIDIDVDRSFFLNCTAKLSGGAIYSTNGLGLKVLSSCFSQCNVLESSGSALLIKCFSQVINETTLYRCGNEHAYIVTHFDGEHSDISRTNYSKSNVRYSVASYTVWAKDPKISYGNTAQCNSSSGVALHANHCKDAIVEYTNIVNNTDLGLVYGLMHFDNTSALLYHLVIIKNIGFSFASRQTKTVVATECYSDNNSSFGFKIDTAKTARNDYRLSYICGLTPSSALAVDRRLILLIISIFLKKS